MHLLVPYSGSLSPVVSKLEAALKVFADPDNWSGNKFLLNRGVYSLDDHPSPASIAEDVLKCKICDSVISISLSTVESE